MNRSWLRNIVPPKAPSHEKNDPAVVAALIAASPARTEEPAESIRAAIVAQLQAFQADDPGAAFAYAAPSMQAEFGTPQTFGRMVATGYPMI